eukprot:scaffold425_cov175-Amphora_coffeaeformis.AAC.68
MASGTLPLEVYHRASLVGSGTFGSVLTVYNDAGEEFALKLFAKEDENEPIDLGALREISCLRLLRQENRHPNIISMVDVQASSTILDDDEVAGAGTEGCIGMALPLFPAGSLAAALTEKRTEGLPRRAKVIFAHGLLSAVAFLHDNGILHRDVKSDNVLLEVDDNGLYKAVLIDFSLAKPIDPTIFQEEKNNDAKSSSWEGALEAVRHTGEVGTVTYTAPEVLSEEEPMYGKPIDLWSTGVVLLEFWQDALLEAQKNSHALKLIEAKLSELPKKPYPLLLRGLLQVDPVERWTARQALQSIAFAKVGLVEPPIRRVNVNLSVPYDNNEEHGNQENVPNGAQRKSVKRRQLVEKLCNELGGAENPITVPAALDYAAQMEQLDDELDDLSKSSALLDCVVLAFRVWELDPLDLEGLEEHQHGSFVNWNREEYIDNENTMFLMLDYCLYPRILRS